MTRVHRLLLLGLLAQGCSPGAAPVASSPQDPSNPGAPEGASPFLATVATAPAAPAESHASHLAATDGGAAVAYVCPMHPEVTSDAPGRCPKCGMNLVPKK